MSVETDVAADALARFAEAERSYQAHRHAAEVARVRTNEAAAECIAHGYKASDLQKAAGIKTWERAQRLELRAIGVERPPGSPSPRNTSAQRVERGAVAAAMVQVLEHPAE